MVKVREPSDEEKLDALLRQLATHHGCKLLVEGWSRKTYDIFLDDRRTRRLERLVRVESLATRNGEVRLYDDRGQALAEDVAKGLEAAFGIEAVLVRETRAPQ